MDDTDSMQGPSYMDQEFNHRGNNNFDDCNSQAASEATSQFNHLNKNAMEKLGEYS